MRRSRLSNAKKSKLMEHFVAGTTARCASELIGVNRKSAGYYFHRLREIITMHVEEESNEILSGEIEVDESYFGGKRGRGAAGKVPVFGLLKRGGRVYNVLDVSEFKHYRINHSKRFTDKRSHINGIENFWNQAKRHLRKFKWCSKRPFWFILKECEWRFNNPNPRTQLKQLKQWVKETLA